MDNKKVFRGKAMGLEVSGQMNPNPRPQGSKLKQWKNGDTLFRGSRELLLKFAGPRKVLSTGAFNGGFRKDLTCVFNYDEKDPVTGRCIMEADTYELHMKTIAEKTLMLDPATCTGLSTAAQMENAVIQELSYTYPGGHNLLVTAIVTGGVDKNGARAGDTALFAENNGFYESTDEKTCMEPGTINIILYVHASMSDDAMARTIMHATEAKVAALEELRCPSLYGRGQATGSGTDGIILVCHDHDPGEPLHLTAVNHMTKAGELVSMTVKEAVKEALSLQTNVNPRTQCSWKKRLLRFDPELPGEDSDDPILTAKACMIASLLDDLWNDMLPAEGVRIAAQQLLCWTAFSEDKAVSENISTDNFVSGNSFSEDLSTKKAVTREILDLFVKYTKKG